jgi:hypothetical protein
VHSYRVPAEEDRRPEGRGVGWTLIKAYSPRKSRKTRRKREIEKCQGNDFMSLAVISPCLPW